MLRLCIAVCVLAASALAEGFTFAVGNAVAAQDFHAKAAIFVFRTEGCAAPVNPQITATAEGLANATRRSVVLKPMPMSKPGVYAVYQAWPTEGAWLVNLKGACGDAIAGAIIPIGPKGFVRDSSRFFARPATNAEIETALKTLTEGANK